MNLNFGEVIVEDNKATWGRRTWQVYDWVAWNPGTGMSQDQLAVFFEIAKLHSVAEYEESTWGIPWPEIRKRLYPKGMTPTQRASLSRTVRRLELHGLLLRLAGVKDGGYKTHVLLTDWGCKFASAIVALNRTPGARIENPAKYCDISQHYHVPEKVNRITANKGSNSHHSVNKKQNEATR